MAEFVAATKGSQNSEMNVLQNLSNPSRLEQFQTLTEIDQNLLQGGRRQIS